MKVTKKEEFEDYIRNMTIRGHGGTDVEPFLATQSMNLGDIVLLHVGQQDKNYESGVYAYGTVIDGPFILTDHPDDYCNGKNTVMIKIERIEYSKPFISHDTCKEFSGQFRTVHRIDPCFYDQIMQLL